MQVGKDNIKRTKTGYDATISLTDNEIPGKINKETGEFTEAEMSKDNIQSGKHSDLIHFEPDAIFAKTFPAGWNWLYSATTPLEYKVACHLANKAHPYTNSLKPLGDDVTVRELAYILQISKSHAQMVIKKLFELGVFGKFEVHADKEYKKYWVFNPYLTFRGKYLQQTVFDLFKDTTIAKVYRAQKEVPCPDC